MLASFVWKVSGDWPVTIQNANALRGAERFFWRTTTQHSRSRHVTRSVSEGERFKSL